MPTFTGAYTPHAGDEFIFKGGDTWGNANFPVVDAAGGGTSAHPDYYGVDPTWYDGSSWSRPIFDADSQNITGADPRASGEQDIFFDLRHTDYVTVDDIEFLHWTASNITGGYGSCAVVELDGDAHVTIDRIFVTGLSIDASGNSDTCAVAFGDTQPPYGGSSVLENSTITGDGTTYGFGAWSIGNIENNTISGIPSMVYPSGHGTISGNLLYDCAYPTIPKGATDLHGDAIEAQASNGAFYIHDNVIHDTGRIAGSECEAMFLGNSGETDYVWNNVLYNLGGNSPAETQDVAAGTAAYFWDNTLSGGENGAEPCIRKGHADPPTFVIENNVCVTNGGATVDPLIAATMKDHNVLLTDARARHDVSRGLLATSPFEYAPTRRASPGVRAGKDLSSYCVGRLVSLCRDANYAGRRKTRSRRAGRGWDAGAYQVN